MIYNSAFQSKDFKNFGINYLQGMLHTYATLNQPQSNLVYEYGIVQIPRTGNNLIRILKEHFEVLANQQFTLELIETEKFKELVTKWLFETNPFPDYKVTSGVNNFYWSLSEITDLKTIYLISNLKFLNYDLGVYYEHFVLENDDNLYLIYFSYCD